MKKVDGRKRGQGFGRGRAEKALNDGGGLEKFILSEMNTLDDVPTVVEDPPDVLRVHSTGEVRVAVMSTITR